MSSSLTLQINNIYRCTDSEFFSDGRGDVILTIVNKVIELVCGETMSDTNYYSKIIFCFKTRPEEIFNVSNTFVFD